ncbi:FUSC family protein [Paludibacterium sp. B53371]|uniref:FUSC family protein n=1 Tax=Paludibacterium sp. B53371 TaxID=2806263 RepID=UPI001C04E9A1|nr:FUSC family protein [Paludibacterium sp. B53371]
MDLRRQLNHWLHPRFRYHQLAVIHGLRLALAFLTARLIGELLNEPHAVWMTVTVAVVMGSLPHTGSIVEKGKQRLIGTTLGALGGFLVIFLTHNFPPLASLAILAIIGYGGFWAVRGGGYIALLTCITLAIVSTNSSFDVGLWRMVNVYAGVVLAIAFGMLFPERARDHWSFMLEESLEGISWLYREMNASGEYNSTLAEGLASRHTKMRELIAAVARETRLGNKALKAILSQLHHARITIEFLASEASDPQRTPDSSVESGHDRVVAALQRLAQQFDIPAGDFPPPAIPPSPQQAWLNLTLARHLEALAETLDDALPKLRGEGNGLPFATPRLPGQ